jgi:hypothetical protein
MIVHIDDDCADQILVASLADTYTYMKANLKNPTSWHEDDVASWKQLLPAIELVGSYYSIDFGAEIKKAKKRAK